MSFSTINYNDHSTDTLTPKIYIESPPDYQIPEVDAETIHVPGRNGDIIIQTGGYKNVQREYKLTCGAENANFRSIAHNITEWANSAHGDYAPLFDSYDVDFPTTGDRLFRYARFTGGVRLTNVLNHAATFTISFDCKPQNFLYSSASTWRNLSADQTVTNPFNTIAKPLIKFKPNPNNSLPVTIVINGSDGSARSAQISASAFTGYLNSEYYIDCENQIFYRGSSGGDVIEKNLNSYITTGHDFFLDLGTGVSTFRAGPTAGSSFNTLNNTIGVKCLWWTL